MGPLRAGSQAPLSPVRLALRLVQARVRISARATDEATRIAYQNAAQLFRLPLERPLLRALAFPKRMRLAQSRGLSSTKRGLVRAAISLARARRSSRVMRPQIRCADLRVEAPGNLH